MLTRGITLPWTWQKTPHLINSNGWKKYLQNIFVIYFIVCQYAVDELCCDEDYVTDKDIISMYQFVDFFKGKARSVLLKKYF